MTTFPTDTDDLRYQFRTVMIVRQVATIIAIIGFGVLAVATGEPWIVDFVATLGLFALAGFVLWGAAGRLMVISLAVRVLIAVDIVLVSIALARTPHPSELAMAFLAIIIAASIALTARESVVVTTLIVGFGIGAVAVVHGPDEVASMTATMTMLAAVAVVLIGMQRGERRVRRLLTRSERQLQRAEQVAGMGSWQWCPTTNELMWSREMYRLTGRDPDGLPIEYEEWISALRPDVREQVEGHAIRAIVDGQDYSYDITFDATESTARRVVQSRGARVFDEDGVVWLVGTAQDVTALRRVEELKDEFVATASHELRTPATIVLGFVRTLDDRWDELDDAVRRRLVKELRRGGERMSQLIEDVLSVARIEHGDLRVEPVDIGVRDAVHDIVSELGDRRVAARIGASVDGTCVRADPERLRQVLYNLVENALRYDPSGGKVQVEVDFARETEADTHLLVCVRDHGPGVDPEERERIFRRFVRGSSSTGGEPGTGLGLYVARSLVRQQGGELWVEDPPDGVGSAFCFTVPIAERSGTRA